MELYTIQEDLEHIRRNFSKDDQQIETSDEDTMIFLATYHLSLKRFQKMFKEAQILLTPNLEQRNFVGDTPMIGWRNAAH